MRRDETCAVPLDLVAARGARGGRADQDDRRPAHHAVSRGDTAGRDAGGRGGCQADQARQQELAVMVFSVHGREIGLLGCHAGGCGGNQGRRGPGHPEAKRGRRLGHHPGQDRAARGPASSSAYAVYPRVGEPTAPHAGGSRATPPGRCSWPRTRTSSARS